MAELGHEVVGVDVDEARSPALPQGGVPFYEPGPAELLAPREPAGRLRFTTRYAEAAPFGDVHFVCVGTPQRPASTPPTCSYVDAVGRRARPAPDATSVLVVGKSTVPVGTAARLARRLAELAPAGRRRRAGLEPRVPARGLRRRGHAAPDRLVSACRDAAGRARRAARGLRAASSSAARRSSSPTSRPPSWSRWPPTPSWPPRSPSSTRWPRCARRPAPTSSTLADAHRLRRAHRSPVPQRRPRLRRRVPAEGHPGVHRPGRRARRRPRRCRFLREVDEINMRRRAARRRPRPRGVRRRARSARGSPCSGAAFKPDTDDVRDSPALDVAGRAPAAGGRRCAVLRPARAPTTPERSGRPSTTPTRSMEAWRGATWCCT